MLLKSRERRLQSFRKVKNEYRKKRREKGSEPSLFSHMKMCFCRRTFMERQIEKNDVCRKGRNVWV